MTKRIARGFEAGRTRREALALADVPGLSAPEDPWVATSAVRKGIPEGAVLVDIALFDVRDFHSVGKEEKFNPPHYAAWIVPPAGQSAVKVIDLGPADKIDAAVQTVRTALDRSLKEMRRSAEQNKPLDNGGQEKSLKTPLAALANLVLEPVLKAIPRDTRQLIVSPDSTLWLVPWAALPLRDGRYAVEQYEIRYLVSSRDLVAPAASPSLKTTSPVVFADPNYDLGLNDTRLADAKLRGVEPTKDDAKRGNENTRDVVAAKSASALPKSAGSPAPPPKPPPSSQVWPVMCMASRLCTPIKKRSKPRSNRSGGHASSCWPLTDFSCRSKTENAQRRRHERKRVNRGRSVPTLLDSDGQAIENPLLRCGLLLAGCNSNREDEPCGW